MDQDERNWNEPYRDPNDPNDVGAARRAPERPVAGRAGSQRSIGELVGDLSRETSELVRKEVQLATTELAAKIDQAERGVISGIAGGAVAYLGVGVLLIAAVLGLAQVVDAWVAALIVGGIVALTGLVLMAKARKDLEVDNLVPEKTVRQTKATGRWIKEHAR